MTKHTSGGTRVATALAFTTLLGLAGAAAAGPPVDANKYLSKQASQEIGIAACGETCRGFVSANVYTDSNGAVEAAFLSLTELEPVSRSAFCQMGSGDLTVRSDAGIATLNTTVDVSNCEVSQTCDENDVCTPDYQDTITVAASLRLPGAAINSTGQTQFRSDEGRSTSTCQSSEGFGYAEAAASVNGSGWTVEGSSAASRNCTRLNKSK